MARCLENLRNRAVFHNLPILHHGDQITNLRGDAQIMRDEDNGKPKPDAQIRKQLQDLRLHGDIKRGDRFIRDQHFRLQSQRAREPNALALPAGKFMWKAFNRRRIKPDQAE